MFLAKYEVYAGWIISKIHYYFKSYEKKKIYVLFSEARGGSTWLMEILVVWLNAFICWEPLHPQRGVVGDGFGDRPTMTNKLHEQLSLIFEGKAHNYWTYSKNKRKLSSFINRENAFIKIVRGSRLLPDLIRKESFANTPVILLRHPAATLISQHRRFKILRTSNYNMPFLMRDSRYLKHITFFKTLEHTLDLEFAIYCMNNSHLYNDNNLPGIVIYYEQFLLDPLSGLKKIKNAWSLDEGFLRSEKFLSLLDQESSEADRSGVHQDKFEQLGKWRKYLDTERIKSFQKILDYFGIINYSMAALLPLDKNKVI